MLFGCRASHLVKLDTGGVLECIRPADIRLRHFVDRIFFTWADRHAHPLCRTPHRVSSVCMLEKQSHATFLFLTIDGGRLAVLARLSYQVRTPER